MFEVGDRVLDLNTDEEGYVIKIDIEADQVTVEFDSGDSEAFDLDGRSVPWEETPSLVKL